MPAKLGAAQALKLLSSHALPEVVDEAIAALADDGHPKLREAILERYAALAANPAKLDGGARLRTSLLDGLRRVAGREDAGLFEAAALTVELRPPGPKDTAQNLRAAALLGLAELDADRAVLYAMRLLDDPHTSGITNQPALTALNVLTFADRMDAVYLQLLRGGSNSEVKAECLRAVTSLPLPLAAELVRDVLKGSDETAMLGAIDLCLRHARSELLLPELWRFLRETELLDVYGYAATAVVASRSEAALERLREELPLTADPRKRQLLDRALELS